MVLFLLIHPSSDACGCSHVGVGEKVQLSADVKNNILKALELNPKDSASLHILGIWHFNVANLDFFSRTFVKVCAAHILKQFTSPIDAWRFMLQVVYGGMPSASNEEAAKVRLFPHSMWPTSRLASTVFQRRHCPGRLPSSPY